MIRAEFRVCGKVCSPSVGLCVRLLDKFVCDVAFRLRCWFGGRQPESGLNEAVPNISSLKTLRDV